MGRDLNQDLALKFKGIRILILCDKFTGQGPDPEGKMVRIFVDPAQDRFCSFR